MSSSRKQAAIRRAEELAESEKQTRVLAEFHNEVMKQIVKVVTERYEEAQRRLALLDATAPRVRPMTFETFVRLCAAEYGADYDEAEMQKASEEEKAELLRVVRMVERHYGVIEVAGKEPGGRNG